MINGEKVESNENSSSRLALVNYDWVHMKIEDIMVLFNSFITNGGKVKKVNIYYYIIKVETYLSEYGREQL